MNAESFFGDEEIFFSTTDPRGVIRFGNQVFLRVSKYSQEEMLGSPHNIIRHPDMPRAVFQLFWSFLNAGKPVVAYVKNMAKDGSYYWVLAVAFPLPDQHVSIRIKPASSYFAKAQAVYAQVLEREKEGGMEEGGRVLQELLKAEGFESYDVFMSRILFEELKVWKPLQISTERKEGKCRTGKVLGFQKDLGLVQEFNRGLFSILDGFLTLNQELLKGSETLLDLSADLGRKALNLSILCANGGEVCAPLSMVARSMTATSRQCGHAIEETLRSISRVLEQTHQASFGVTAPLLQGETIASFVQEFCGRLEGENITSEEEARWKETMAFLLGILNSFSEQAMGVLKGFDQAVGSLVEGLDSFRRDIRSLELIHGTGMIEVAHAGSAGQSALGVLEAILKSAQGSGEEIKRFIRVARAIQGQCSHSLENGARVLMTIRWMRESCMEQGDVARLRL